MSRRPVLPARTRRRTRALLRLGLAALALAQAPLGNAQPGSAPPTAPASSPPPAPPTSAATGLDLLAVVRLALAEDPNITLAETRLQSARGSLLIASGMFDPIVTSGLQREEERIPLAAGGHRQTRVTTGDAGIDLLLRSGLSVAPVVTLLRTEEPTAGPGGANLGTVAFTFRQPLLRGRGRAVVTAFEQAAEREVAASSRDLRQATAERVFAVAAQYWVTRAAALNLEILGASEASSRELLETTRRLIEADQTPAAELVQVEANLAAKESSRIGGERQLFDARQDLGREIGLDPDDIAALPLPDDPFPNLAPDALAPAGADGGAVDRLVDLALAHRDDLAAAYERRESVEALLRASTDALKPRLDLVFTPGYTGRVDGLTAADYVSALINDIPGLSSTLGLRLTWPTANRTARGELEQRLAARSQSELVIELLAKGVGADVPAAFDAVVRDAQQASKAREAVALFERAVVNEEKKLRAGSSTLLDLISQRDRLTAARQNEVSARLALALALLDLRLQTGTLLQPQAAAAAAPDRSAAFASETATITEASLTTVPLPEAP